MTGTKRLGVIGGLGPMATAYFMELLTQMTDAETDQEHIEVLIYSKPSIPDRTKYILGESDKNPLPDMIYAGGKLKEAGAELLAIPCITAHYFHNDIEQKLEIPVINGPSETASYLAKEKKTCAGILATDGTLQSKLLQNALNNGGIQSVLPGKESQKKVMSMVYEELKAGKSVDMEKFTQVSAELFEKGAQVILLACTELSLIKKEHKLPAGYLDVMEVMARAAVERCHHVRKEFDELITES